MNKITHLTLLLIISLLFSNSMFSQTTLNFAGGFQIVAPFSASPASGTIALSDGNVYSASSVGGGSGVVTRNSGSLAFTMNASHSYFSFGRNDGTEFQLDNVIINFQVNTPTSATLTGYKDGLFVSGATQAIAFTINTPVTVDVSSDSDFDDIDEIRITYSSAPDNNASLQLQSLTYSTAVATGLTIITFDVNGFVDDQNLGATETISGFVFDGSNGGLPQDLIVDLAGAPAGLGLIPSLQDFMDGDVLTITKVGGTNFEAISFEYASNLTTGLVAEAFDGGVSVGSQSLNSPGAAGIFTFNSIFGNVDEVRITGAGGFGLLASLDNFSLNPTATVPACTAPTIPIVSASVNNTCPGTAVTIDWAGATLGDATNWHIYTTACGTGALTSQTGTNLVVSPSSTTTYYVRGEDGAGCVVEGTCGFVTVNVTDIDTDSDGQCNSTDPDDDNDGVADGSDLNSLNPDICGDSDADGCDDCAVGTDGFGPLSDFNPANDGTDTDGDGECNTGDVDDDNDGVADGSDPSPLNPNLCGDSDADGCDDCAVGTDDFGPLADNNPANDGADNDGDGICNSGDPDDDNDGVLDGADPNDANPFICGDSDADGCDDCSIGVDGFGPLSDSTPASDGVDTDSDGICDSGDPDDDNDGVADGSDPSPLDPNLCGDSDADGCDDCVVGTDGFGPLSDFNPANDGTDTDSDGICNTSDTDDDNDGVADGSDPSPLNPNLCGDSDADGCDDCAVGTDDFGPLADNNPANDGADNDGDGICNSGDPDDDNDGVLDGADPNDNNPFICGDSDADGCDDCSNGVDGFGPLSDSDPSNDGTDTDSDGICNTNDTDDDNDGVADGSDPSPLDPSICGDSNGDSCDDCMIGTDGFGPLADNVFESTPPTPICQNINAYLDVAGNAVILAADLNNGSTDNCGILTFSASQTTFNCSEIGPNAVILTVTDGSSNMATCPAVVTVMDTITSVNNCNGALVWTGNVSTDWNTPGNWNLNLVPTFSDVVSIPNVGSGVYPNLTSATSVGDVSVGAGAELTVSSGAVLVISAGNTLTNNGTITLVADVNGTGILDDFTNAGASFVGNITVQQYISPGSGLGQRLVSSPVDGGVISGLDPTYTGYPLGQLLVDDCINEILMVASPYSNLLQWNEPAVATCQLEGWEAIAPTTALSNGRGYSGWVNDGSLIEFTGAPNSGVVNSAGLGNSASGITEADGWHLLGNPYPSPVSVSDLQTVNGPNFTSYSYYDGGSGSFGGTYQPLLPGDNIAIMQGFVANSATTNTFSFNNSTRTTANTTFKNGTVWYESKLDVSLSGNNFSDITYLYYNQDASANFDYQWDCVKRQSNVGQPTLFTGLESDKLALNGQHLSDFGQAVPLGLLVGTAGTYELRFDGLPTFPENTTVYLEDKQTNVFHNIASGNYSFTSTTEDAVDRFELHFVKPVSLQTSAVNCNAENGVLVSLNESSTRNYDLMANGTIISSGSIATMDESLEEGVYELIVYDQYGGTQNYAIAIDALDFIDANIQVSATKVEVDESITLSNLTWNATIIEWTINNEVLVGINNLNYAFDQAGIYHLSALVSNDDCSDTHVVTIQVADKTTGLINLGEEANVNIFASNGLLNVEFENVKTPLAEVALYNLLGQEVLTIELETQGNQEIELPVLANSYYIVKLQIGTTIYTEKVWVGK